MSKADNRSLRFRPLENGKIPSRPVLDHLRARILLVFEPHQYQVAAMTRGEARNLNVIAHQVIGGRKLVDFALEELLLIVIARSPRKHRSDIESFAQNMTHHILWEDSLSRTFIMRAPGGVNMMIPRIPAKGSGINPPLKFER